jgi:hypothetical protein
MLFRFAAPMAANWRMKNLFELAPFLGRLKNNTAKCGPVQLPAFSKNSTTKCLTDFGTNVLILTGKLACHHVGIKEGGFGKQLAQAIYKG